MLISRQSKLACAIAVVSGSVFAEPAAQTQQTGTEVKTGLEEVVITGVRQRLYETGMLKNVIEKTEVINASTIAKLQATNIGQAIDEAPGVQVNNECSMCGVKRVMLNGMRGEHTNILVDGIPLYTMLSGFYGIDAATSAGIERIEIARGAGASLIAPEAIGGTINIITREAIENSVEVDMAMGEDDYRLASVVATGISDDGATGITFIGQYDNLDDFDGDNNGVSENPALENKSSTIRVTHDLTASDNITLRLNKATSEIFGGPAGSSWSQTWRDFQAAPNFASPQLFVGDDVRNDYIGRTWETAERIKTDRLESYVTWLHEFSTGLNVTITGAYSQHEQESFYEGFVYDADDDMAYGDIRFNYTLNDNHLLTFGIDTRNEEMRSKTNSTSPAFVSDSFDYVTYGVYLQDTWAISENLEINLAIRIDEVEADFVDPQKPGTEIDETVISPRLDMRYLHNDQLTSRFSAGRGYRAPLSFFESDHGILDGNAGFQIDINDLEKSVSGTYSLTWEGDRLSVTGSIAYTEVENMAFLTETNTGVPLLSQLDDDASVVAADIALTYQLTDNLSLSATAEHYDYNSDMKQSFGVVPVEDRLTLSSDWDYNNWEVFVSATWVGSRDLSEFGTPAMPSFDLLGLQPQSTSAPAYWTVDFRVSKKLGENYELYAGALNLLDYNQAEDQSTPLFYEGGSYDVGYIYGPLRGRQAYAGIKMSF